VRMTGAVLVSFLQLMGVAPAAASPQAEQASAVRPTDAPPDAVLPLRYDESTGKVFLTIPRLGEDLLYLNTLATGFGLPGSGLDRGEAGLNALVRFERHGARVVLVRPNTAFRASSGDVALERSVAESFPRSVLATFAIQEDVDGHLVVDATDFLLSDVFDVVGRLRGARLGTVRLDRDRSFIDARQAKAFPANTEVRAVLSFVTDDPSPELRRLAPDGRSVTLEQHHSFLALPDPPMAIRRFDPRAGIFPFSFFDFAQPFDSDYRQRGLSRWRLEPTDQKAYLGGELVEPVTPIVYYLDPAIPEPYRAAFIEGGEWWNRVFESAGWRNAFRIEPLPAGIDPLDARYPMIYWVHRAERGPSVGPAFRDPRTGEILTTIVRMDSYRSLVNHDIYMGLVPAAPASGLQLPAEEFAMARRRQHTAHEIGHTLGLAHNFIAATQDRASVMDYPYALVRLDDQGRLDITEAYSPAPGAHDIFAIRYAYTWYPTPEAEAAGLQEILHDAERRGLRFVADAHVGAAGSVPDASQWIEGGDMISALQRTMAVRRMLLEQFDARAAQPGEPLAVLNRRFAHVYLHHRYALAGATKYIGGMDFTYAMHGGGDPPTRVLPPADQRRALRLILEALQPGELRVRDAVTALIPPVPFGYDDDLTLVRSQAGPAFDPLGLAHSLAQEVVDGLLHPQRAARVALFHARDPANLSLDELTRALVDATWGTAGESSQEADTMSVALRRVAQRAVVDGLIDLASSREATPAARASAGHQLERLLPRVSPDAAGSVEDRAHQAIVRRDIERSLAGEDEPAARPRPQPVPLPWP
jgi:hypothetical protein